MNEQTTLPGSDFTPWPDDVAACYRERGFWRGQPLGELLRDAAAVYGDRYAVIDGNKTQSYAELDRKADELATGFIELGLKANDKVVVQLPNIGEFFEIIFALFRIGAVPVLALPAHRLLEVGYFCRFTEAKAYIIADSAAGFDYRTLARKLVESISSLQHAIVVGDAQEFQVLNTLYREPPPVASMIASPVASAVALLQLSGGTTNVSKLIPRTHDDYFYSIRASTDICQLNCHSVYLAVLPVAHNFPLTSPGVLGVLSAGGTVVLSASGAPDVAFELIEKHRVTITAVVPPLAMAWLNAVANTRRDLSSLQVLQVGGAKLSAEAAKKIGPSFNCKLQQVFGMAEGLVNYTRLDDDDDIVINTQGRPISPADEIRIVDENDKDVPPGRAGELLTRGPYTIRGYYRAAAHNTKAFTVDGYYRSGDIVRLTAEGYLVVEGRAKDQINRGGEKIPVAEVEEQLLEHPAIHDVAIVSMPDPYLDERSCAFIVLADSTARAPRMTELRTFLRERGLAEFKVPDRVEIIAVLPKTPFGKVSKQDLRRLIADKLKQSLHHEEKIYEHL